MKSSLSASNRYHSGFLEKITLNVCSFYGVVLTKIHLHVLTKSAGVVISHSFAVTESLKKRVA